MGVPGGEYPPLRVNAEGPDFEKAWASLIPFPSFLPPKDRGTGGRERESAVQ